MGPSLCQTPGFATSDEVASIEPVRGAATKGYSGQHPELQPVLRRNDPRAGVRSGTQACWEAAAPGRPPEGHRPLPRARGEGPVQGHDRPAAAEGVYSEGGCSREEAEVTSFEGRRRSGPGAGEEHGGEARESRVAVRRRAGPGAGEGRGGEARCSGRRGGACREAASAQRACTLGWRREAGRQGLLRQPPGSPTREKRRR